MDFPLFSILCGLKWWLLGVFSFAFHAHPSSVTILLDVGGIYVALSPCVVYVALFFIDVNFSDNVLYWIRSTLIAAQIVLSILLMYYKWELSAIKVMAGMLGVVIISILLIILSRFAWLKAKCCFCLCPRSQKSWRLKKSVLFPAFALSLFLAALGSRETEAKEGENKCDQMGVFRQHAVWHCLCAGALLNLYFLYRVEHIDYVGASKEVEDADAFHVKIDHGPL